ncbi:pyridoxamine 5'-phosphate oxidase family protein [Sinomonas sp.]|jgi:nitroimidazol reductase NimA-like FMN-containing flavoprotein (pyridoxamine 5'-phosphate oxidase superfamily)|uniref:pyridoxamine 5'-phosphate oxidase family protein n=1 Tax=Sinomonas sp. TaxID=1914986 RepID=UPI002FE03358
MPTVGDYGPGVRHEDFELDEEKCWALLGSSGIGRFAFADRGRIQVFPVHYAVHRGGIYFRTSPEGVIAAALPQEGAAFEIDSARPDAQAGWSVLVSGTASAVEDSDLLTELFGLAVQEPWAGGIRDRFVRLVPRELTGRQVFLA